MKTVIIGALLFAFNSFGQAFYFNSTSTTLIKNTNQSPAHWYIEIFSNEAVDTTLRWKASFSNIPTQWNINFDNQDVYHPVVNDGDSADFTLFTGMTFPQKLIIGAELYDTPGSGSVYFDIYDPNDPGNVTQIEYRFIVSAAGLSDLEDEGITLNKINGNFILTTEHPINFQMISLDGKVLIDETVNDKFVIDAKKFTESKVLIAITYQNKIYSDKIYLGQ